MPTSAADIAREMGIPVKRSINGKKDYWLDTVYTKRKYALPRAQFLRSKGYLATTVPFKMQGWKTHNLRKMGYKESDYDRVAVYYRPVNGW